MLYANSFVDLHLEQSWVTVGTFDGVHRGHQSLLESFSKGAHSLKLPPVVVTFHPHPREVVNGRSGPFYLTTPSERVALLNSLGIEVVLMLPFNVALASMTAYDFTHTLVSRLGMKQLWVGHDFAMGRDREGTVPYLRKLGLELGYRVVEVKPIIRNSGVVSSSRIRSLISIGDVHQAASLLGRPYQLSGEVVLGHQRGRQVGIPTANLAPPEGKLIPATGVYACRSEVNGQIYAAAVNIGVRPTFTNQQDAIFIEAHILDFSEDVYGKSIVIEFEQRLRDEQRFESIEALVAQVHTDIQCTREIISIA